MAAAWMRLVPPAGAVAGTAPPYGQNADSTFFFSLSSTNTQLEKVISVKKQYYYLKSKGWWGNKTPEKSHKP